MILNIIHLLRPSQWLKNGFVVLPVFFGRHITDMTCIVLAMYAFAAFCFAASGVYCLNDIRDVEADRKHAHKCKRPIASGAISKPIGYLIMLLCWGVSIGFAILAGDGESQKRLSVCGIILAYITMNILYCIRLKNIGIVDVFIVSAGFVLRVIAGGVAADIWVSQWIVLMTFLLALFLAFAKRRDDVIIYENTGILPRKNVNRYNLHFVNHAIGMVASVTMVCYIMYTVSDEVVNRVGNNYLYMTSVFVLAGLMRYLQIAMVDANSGSPTKVLIHDHFIHACIFCWIFTFIIILYL